MVQELHRRNAAQKLTIKHHHPYIVCHSPHVSRLLLQLPHRALRRAFPSIHQAGWDLNNDFINGWPELFLEQNLLARRFGENGDNSNTVYFRGGGASLLKKLLLVRWIGKKAFGAKWEER